MKFRFLLLPSLLGIACDSSTTVEKIQNIPPAVNIQSHSDAAEFLEGEEIQFYAKVSDQTDEINDLTASWYVDDELVCEWAMPEPDGTTRCELSLAPENNRVSVQVNDPEGGAGQDEISVTVTPTDAPTVQITSPIAGEVYYSDQLILFSAILADNEDNPTDLTYTWESNVDGALPITASVEDSGEVEQYLYLSEGQHALSITVTDAAGKISTETVAIIVGGQNNDPTCAITTPAQYSAYVVGQNVLFEGTATDADINDSLLSISWESDQDGVFNTTAANTSGELNFVYDGLSAGNHTITLRVEDEVGGICSDTLILAVGTPPNLTLNSPTDGSIHTVGEIVSFEATVADQEDIPSDISISWNSDIDGEFSTQAADSSGNISFPTSVLSAGVHGITITATDSTGLTNSTALSLRINTPPSSPTVVISPEPATTTDNLVASAADSVDADGENISYTYEWFQNGVATSYTSASVPQTATAYGEEWKIRVTPSDGYTNGNYTEASILIANSVPTISDVAISPANPLLSDIVTCTATANDADQTITPTYTWTINGTTYSGATIDLGITNAMPTDVITCTASATDDTGESVSLSTAASIENQTPTISSTTISPTTVYTSSLVSCSSVVVDLDGETTLQSYSWSLNSVEIATGNSIQLSTATSSVGDSLVCTVTATDNYGGVTTDNTSVTITNTLPSVDSITMSPTEPSKHETLTCNVSASDLDQDTLSYTFTWKNLTNNTTYATTTTTSTSDSFDLSAVSTQMGDMIECNVTATDSNGGINTLAQTVEIRNSTPMFDQGAAIFPSTNVVTNTLLTCSATVTDPDDGAITPSFAWHSNGVFLTTGSTYTVMATDVGNTVDCTATATDSDGETATSTASVTVENTPPEITIVNIDQTSVFNDDTVSCSAIVSDPDEVPTIGFSWMVNTTTIGTGDTISLDSSLAMPGDNLICSVTTTDGQGATDTDMMSISISNRAPSSPIISISPTEPQAGLDDLVCSLDVLASDDDDQTITYTIDWMANGVSYTGTTTTTNYNGDTIPATELSPSEEWICMVTPDDGIDTGPQAATSVTVESEWDGPLNFTTCGKTGRFGPSQSQCDGDYNGTTLDSQVTVTDGYQYWTVPQTGTYSFAAYGAGESNGQGALIYGELTLNTGDVLTIVVGQQGETGGGGHGGTFVANGSTPLIVAGGGGAMTNCSSSNIHASTSETGNPGNLGYGGTGGDGGHATEFFLYGGGGGGGFYTDGTDGTNYGGKGYAFLNGAWGGDKAVSQSDKGGGFGGGGAGYSSDEPAGGGGYSGGGGGGASNHGSITGGCRHGGGGGSFNSGTNQANSANQNSGPGSLIIDRL